MWGYHDTPWIKSVIQQSEVAVHSVKKPAETIKIPNGEATLWRYMDLAKLLALLQNKSLYFSRIDKLGDQFEGRWSERTIMMLWRREHLWVFDETDQAIIEDKGTGDRLTFQKKEKSWSAEETISHWASQIIRPESALRHTYVNCWYAGEEESEAMWRLFAGDKYGTAIRTCARKFLGSFKEFLPDYFGEVKYVSYDSYAIPIAAMPPVFYKRSAFSHEREVRAIIAPKQREAGAEDIGTHGEAVSINCPVDTGHLIEEIIVSPYSPAWLYGVVQGEVRNLGMDIEVRKSVMGRAPLGTHAYGHANHLQVYFSFLLGAHSTCSSCLRIWATSRKDAFTVAREEWDLPEQDMTSLDVLTQEEYQRKFGCLPKQFKHVLNRLNNAHQNSLDPDSGASTR